MWIHYRLRRTVFWDSSSVQSCLDLWIHLCSRAIKSQTGYICHIFFLKKFLSWEQTWQKSVRRRNNNDPSQLVFKYPNELETMHGWSQNCLVVCHSHTVLISNEDVLLGPFFFQVVEFCFLEANKYKGAAEQCLWLYSNKCVTNLSVL